MKKEILSFEQFYKTCYHTNYYLHIPLIDRIKVDKREYLVKGKYNAEVLRANVYEIYEQNLHRLKI